MPPFYTKFSKLQWKNGPIAYLHKFKTNIVVVVVVIVHKALKVCEGVHIFSMPSPNIVKVTFVKFILY